jgi:transcriptional regulator with XRE-family HTH domain
MTGSQAVPGWARRLAELRRARHWSVADVAEKLKGLRDGLPSVQALSHMIRSDWETGRHRPGPRYRPLLMTIYGVDEADVFTDDPPAEHGPPYAVASGLSTGADLSRDHLADVRPELLALGIPGRAAAQIPAQAGRGRVAPELVEYFYQQLPGHYRAEMHLGPHLLIPTVTAQVQLITYLLTAAEQPVRRGLLGAGVAYAALIGWLHQDAGDLARSGYWRGVALDMAHRSGDVQLVSYALSNKAQLATDLGDGRAVVDYAQSALAAGTLLCPKVRILALQHQAHGYSLLGERAMAERLIDEAATLTDHPDDGYTWGNAYRRTPAYLSVQRATVLSRLGLDAASDAVHLWDQILGGMPESARRDNAVFWVRQASALGYLNEPDRVVEIAAAAAGMVAETGSARLRGELLKLSKTAYAWADSRSGRELREIASSVRPVGLQRGGAHDDRP